MARRATALSRGPQGSADSSVGHEGLGFRVARTAVTAGAHHGARREPVLAGALPELQDDVPVPRGKLRTGRGRVVALYVRRVSVIHPRYSAHAGGIAPHEPGLPQSGDTGERMTADEAHVPRTCPPATGHRWHNDSQLAVHVPALSSGLRGPDRRAGLARGA